MRGAPVAAPAGDLIIESPGARTASCDARCVRAHSWAHDGRRVCWRPANPVPAQRYAVDVEVTSAPVPSALGARWPLPRREFWSRWTQAEVAAKLSEVPILIWLRTHGLDGAETTGWSMWTSEVDDLTVTVGSGPSRGTDR